MSVTRHVVPVNAEIFAAQLEGAAGHPAMDLVELVTPVLMRRPGAPSGGMRHKHAVTHFPARSVLLQEVLPGVSPCDNALIPPSASITVRAGAKVIVTIVSLCLLPVTSTGLMNAVGEQSKGPTDKFAVEVRRLAIVAMLETLQTRVHSQSHDPQLAPVHVHVSVG